MLKIIKNLSNLIFIQENTMLYQYNPLRRPYLQIDMLERPADYLTYWHRHDFFHLIYVFSGDLTLLFEKEQAELAPGNIILVPAGRMHNLASRRGYIQYGINFYLPESDAQYHMLTPFSDKAHVRFMPELLPLLQKAFMLSERVDSIGLRLLYSLLDTVLFSFFEQIGMENRPNHLARLLDYIDQHLTEPQTLDSLAAAMNLSASHLERLCYGHFDMGAKALYNRRRFEHAASLLANESMSIQEISETMGFTEPSNFTNFFKRYTDCSPSLYRKRYLNL